MKILSYLILLTIFTYGCGFKVVKQSNFKNFYISKIETSGDRKASFNIKNRLNFLEKNEEKKGIILSINTIKNKTVKEKNSRNETTKYLISISSSIKVKDGDKTLKILNLKEEIDYNVGTQHSQTISNENKAVKIATDTLVKKIIKEISLVNFNDL